jgi:hypothetical protein
VRILLTRKLAACLDGVDVSQHQEGDVIELPVRDAGLLIAEGWAVAAEAARGHSRRSADVRRRALGADAALTKHTVEQLRDIRDRFEQRRLEEHESRRAEDQIREELQDERARVVTPERNRAADTGDYW